MRPLNLMVVGFLALLLLGLTAPQQSLAAQLAPIDLVPNLPSGQPVGTTVEWSVQADGDRLNQFSVMRQGEAFQVMYTYAPQTVFEWTPLDEGTYTLRVQSREVATGVVSTVDRSFQITSRVTTEPEIFPTEHPLVALYSLPACPSGAESGLILFRQDGATRVNSTSSKPCDGDNSLNFYVAGMRPTTTYWMQHIYLDAQGGVFEVGEQLAFTTDEVTIDWGQVHPQVIRPAQVSFAEPLLLQAAVGRDDGPMFSMATDNAGYLVWYYDPGPDFRTGTYLTRMVEGGTVLLLMPDEITFAQVMREVDLAGNIVRQIHREGVNLQLDAQGLPPISGMHHEAVRLDNGHTLVIGALEKIVVDQQGPGEVNVMGDVILDFDENLQLVWYWSSFDHLDVSRKATLRETCRITCNAPLYNGTNATDWTHSNTIDYSHSDGNLILSVRNQDWVIKVNYQDGTGDGALLWRLGLQGDFAISPPSPFAWFTHQHDTRYIADDLIIIYDNSTLRCELWDQCASRGQVYQVDEENMTATLVFNKNLNRYAKALGGAQVLANGNYHFTSGVLVNGQGTHVSRSDEIAPDGTPVYRVTTEGALYRSYRVQDLYTPPVH